MNNAHIPFALSLPEAKLALANGYLYFDPEAQKQVRCFDKLSMSGFLRLCS